MDDFLWVRVAASLLVDVSLTVLCGLLLAGRWLAGLEGAGLRWGSKSFRVLAAVLGVASAGQVYLLAMSFSGRTNVRAVLATLPDIRDTHTGSVLLGQCAVAIALFVTTWIRQDQVREVAASIAMLCCLGLHGAVGHAAVDGAVSWTEGLQWVHLLGMALWSGGVMVSGFALVPWLRRSGMEPTGVRTYMARLSAVSTWSVMAVLLSGAAKSYRATGGSLGPIRTSHWGHLLLVKVVLVTLAVLFGARNRWLLAAPGLWGASREGKAARTLLAESICMAGVLVLSAWLANSAPPLE